MALASIDKMIEEVAEYKQEKLEEIDRELRAHKVSDTKWLKRSTLAPVKSFSTADPWYQEAQELLEKRYDGEEDKALHDLWKNGTNYSNWEPTGRNASCPECLRDEVFIPNNDYICKWCRDA